MKNKIATSISFLCVALTTLNPLFANAGKITGYVNPFIGTGAIENSLSGNNYPGATCPFGMVQLSPDTREAPDWDVASGYNYNDKQIYGFSHTHLSGTGVAELFDVMLMPVSGDINDLISKETYHSSFSHQDESAHPGYYRVKLSDTDIQAELTATTRCGFHKYTFPSDQAAQVVFDLNHSRDKGSWGTRIILSQIRIIDEYTIEGFRIITGWPNLRKVCFYAKLSKPIRQSALKNGETVYFNTPLINGNRLKAILDFETTDPSPLLIKIGISPVNMDNARLNLEKEIPGWDFEQVVSEANETWEKELGKIQAEGTDEQKQIFYTALYHTFIQPNTMSDVNGEYTQTDFTTGQSNERVLYSTFSLWDTYRAAHPLYTLVQQQKSADFVNSLIAYYDTYGYLPIWHLWGQENYCMIGNHSIPVITDAILKNIPGIDKEKAFEAIRNSSLTNHPNSPFNVWEKYGYMPENIQSQSVSITLEMAYNDWCVAQLAKALDKKEDDERFSLRARNYRNLHNSQTNFFQSKDDKGHWIEPFDPFRYGSNGGYPFTEGNAWQYYWYVPQDIPDLIALTGGDKAFVQKLDEFFTNEHHEELNDNASGFIGQYAHGNEPSHHVAYLYNYAGEPWKTQKYVSQIMTELYNTNSAGYAGNDDCGEMSAWYVFSAMGFYPVNPANGVYAIGSPLLKNIKITLENSKTFTIHVQKKSEKDIYIQSVRLNGKQYNRTYITHQEIVAGGNMEFVMGNKPSKWGTGKDNRPQ